MPKGIGSAAVRGRFNICFGSSCSSTLIHRYGICQKFASYSHSDLVWIFGEYLFDDNGNNEVDDDDYDDDDDCHDDDDDEKTLTAVEFQSFLLKTTPSLTVSFWLWLVRSSSRLIWSWSLWFVLLIMIIVNVDHGHDDLSCWSWLLWWSWQWWTVMITVLFWLWLVGDKLVNVDHGQEDFSWGSWLLSMLIMVNVDHGHVDHDYCHDHGNGRWWWQCPFGCGWGKAGQCWWWLS